MRWDLESSADTSPPLYRTTPSASPLPITPQVRAIVQRVPQYTKVTLADCTLRPKDSYNGQTTGGEINSGIIAFAAKEDVTLGSGSAIDVSSRGHRGAKVPDRRRCENGDCSVRTPGWYAADAFFPQVPSAAAGLGAGRGKSVRHF